MRAILILLHCYSSKAIFLKCIYIYDIVLQFCKKVWLGIYDSRTFAEPDSKDDQKVREFMAQKYEKKRWYVAPTESMKDEARQQNTPPSQSTKNLKSLAGNNVPKLVIHSQQVTVK